MIDAKQHDNPIGAPATLVWSGHPEIAIHCDFESDVTAAVGSLA